MTTRPSRPQTPAPESPRRRLRWPAALAWLVALLLSAVIAIVAFVATGRPARPVQPATGHFPAAAPPPLAAVTPTARVTAGGLPALPHGPTGPAHAAPSATAHTSPPTRLVIAAIGVDTGLESLGRLPDGTLQAPAQWGVAGWYAAGVRPGDPGPAVIVGHVDSVHGPAVFYRLRNLHLGAVALVRQQTGATLRFIIDSVDSYPKTSFPTEAVYGPTPLPELRLVTCTGEFDWAAHSYLDNLVVSAHLT